MFGNRQNTMHPFFLNLERMPLLIVGCNETIFKVVKSVCKSSSNSKVIIFDEIIPDYFKEFAADKTNIVLHERQITPEDLQDLSLLSISVDDHEYEEYVLNIAHHKDILISVNGKPQISDFSLVSVIKNEHLKIGISSNDYSPEIAARVNHIVGRSIPSDIGEFIQRLKTVQKDPLMNNIDDELTELDRLTADYLSQKQKSTVRNTEFEHLSKLNKAVQKRANIYLGIIGVLVFVGIFSYILVNFELMPEIKTFLNEDNHIFYKMLAVGFIAEIVAGSMGMGYGVICTTILLLMNVAPPVVSASIHSAETFTSAAGSISHYKLKNVNMKLVKALAPAAIIGAIIGAVSLTYFGEHYAHIVKPIISCYTLYLGINILRNAFKDKRKKIRKQKTKKKLNILGLVGGFIDSFAGGGWGPLVTGTLMKDGRTPRYVVGSSTFSKFLLTITSAVTFVFTIGIQHWNIVLGLLIGGIITAPFSAMLTAKLPVKKMFIIIGCLVIIMSSITIFRAIF